MDMDMDKNKNKNYVRDNNEYFCCALDSSPPLPAAPNNGAVIRGGSLAGEQ